MGVIAIISILLLVGYFSFKNKKVKPVQPRYVPQEIKIKSELVDLINSERILNNLPELKIEKLLVEIAKEKVTQMKNDGITDHLGFEKRFIKSKATKLLENVASNFSTDYSYFNAYMNSEKHKKNILDKTVTHIGVTTQGGYNCCLFAKY